MKKAVSFVMALVLCLSLCACGGNDVSKTEAPTETTVPEERVMAKEELLSIATNDYWYSFAQEVSQLSSSNILKANSTYQDTTVFIMGLQISNINSEYAVAANGFAEYHIYLPYEELAELKRLQYVCIVGTITSISEGTSSETSRECAVVDIKPAYIVEKSFTIHRALVSFVKTDTNGKKYCGVSAPDLIPQYDNFIVYFPDDATKEIEEAMKTHSVMVSLKGDLYLPENINNVPESPFEYLYIYDAELIDMN